MPKDKDLYVPISVRISQEIADRMDAFAKANADRGRHPSTRTDFVRAALYEYLSRHEKEVLVDLAAKDDDLDDLDALLRRR